MRRKTFDLIASGIGVGLTLTLVLAGALLLWASIFTTNEVRNQLATQDVTFPAASAFAHAKPGTEITPGMRPYLLQYAGQEVLTGAQAEAYADHFIAVHLSQMPYHGIYSTVSAASLAHPTNAALAAEVQTVFRGTTLRSMLLEAYGFGTMGSIALLAAVASFALAALMIVLTTFGYWHMRRVSPSVEAFATQVGGLNPAR
ncbi:MAG TPA: hypothetical protein VNH20_04975 [Candidatus Dormibacteraeota bacterium]|nr:hypothetical protein [Candidatus Dormibacteraeota bacterium]